MADKKEYSPEEVAKAILSKCNDLYKNSTLAKANTAHEVETGSEAHNDDAETPEQLEAGEVCKEGSFSADKKKKKKGEDSEGSEGSEESDSEVSEEDVEDIAEEEAEEEVEEHNEEMHEDEKEESEDEDEKEDKKKDKKELPFEKSERPLKAFMAKRLAKSNK